MATKNFQSPKGGRGACNIIFEKKKIIPLMFSLVTKNISVGLSDGNQRNLVTKKRGACHMFLESPQ
jgi:hypothetical protein